MYAKIMGLNIFWLIIFFVFSLSGCSKLFPDNTPEYVPTGSDSSSTITRTQERPRTTPEIDPTPTADTPTSTPTTHPTLIPEATASITLTLRDDCPKIITLEPSAPMLIDGSVLFSVEQSGIWAISAGNLSPQMIYEIPLEQGNWVILSPDGSKLARFERSNSEDLYEGATVIYDLTTQEETRVPAPENPWFQLWDWLPDGRLRYLINIELNQNVGQLREFFLVDPSTIQTETLIEEINLPGFTFDERNIQLGFASLDPNRQLVLYTKSGMRGVDVVLLDLETKMVVWEQRGTVGGLFSEPRWTADGSNVVFGMPDPETEGDYIRLFNVRRDGQEEHLAPQPLPETDIFPIRYAVASPDGQYVHYSLWYSRFEGPGFILDTTTYELGEICGPSTIFLDGQWISGSQLLYRVRKEDDSTMSLRIFDVLTWTTLELVESSPNSTIEIFGWTPIEFP